MAGIVYTCSIETPLGPMTASAGEDCLTGLWFAGQRYFPSTGAWRTKEDHPVFEKLRIWLKEYFAGVPSASSPWGGVEKLFALNPGGTGFQKRVWKALMDIPYGTLSSYGAIAKRLGSGPRAVGGAVGHNPISILIPCHRVAGSSGKLTGYAGGLDRKEALLKLEGAVYKTSQFQNRLF